MAVAKQQVPPRPQAPAPAQAPDPASSGERALTRGGAGAGAGAGLRDGRAVRAAARELEREAAAGADGALTDPRDDGGALLAMMRGADDLFARAERPREAVSEVLQCPPCTPRLMRGCLCGPCANLQHSHPCCR